MEMWFVIWRSYGEWRQTSCFFETPQKAQRHVELYLTDHGKDYNTDIEVRSITLPESRS